MLFLLHADYTRLIASVSLLSGVKDDVWSGLGVNTSQELDA